MIKQIYRFLTIILVSNLIFSPMVLSKTQNTDQAKNNKSLLERLFDHKNSEKQKIDNNQNSIRPNNINQVTRYGVFKPNSVYNTYPGSQTGNKKTN